MTPFSPDFPAPLPQRASARRRGFSLIEVVLAIGIASFAVLTIIGLLGVAMHTNSESEQRIAAADLATRIVAHYKEILNGATPTGWNSPLPAFNSIGNQPPGAFTNPEPISNDGQKTNVNDADYALSYAVWADSAVPDKTGYKLVNCAIRLGWPAAGVLSSSDPDKFESYIVTTSFLVNPQ